ncbi:shugoshin 1 [Arvicola amphibius]|uniref:shugoshin 1 n=1 Tax=Arvicola amphibius TaxID=1047088 RepID=UPI0018E39352|nr:shugoshin 1 [Arvicola amphibius]
MVKERCQKKSFQDSLEDIKKRMKEKRNKNLSEVGKRKSFIVAPCQVPTNTATLLKNYQDNNRLLVLALENEKSKVREAQDIILQLRRECYHLAYQLYTVKEKLTSQQSEDIDQNRNGCISEVVSSSDNTIRDLSVKTLQQIALEENDWSFQTKETSSTVTLDTLGSDFDSGKVESTDDILPKTVSFRHHLKKDFSNVSCSAALDDCEASHWVEQSLEVRRSECKDPTITLHKLENVEQNVCLWNKDQINLSPRLTYPGKDAKTKVILPSEPEQTESKHQRAQKRAQRRRANQKCKSKSSLRCKGKKSKDKHTLQPTKLDRSLGSGDAYDFNVEESVHLTPFRQKMSNGSSEEINSVDQEGNAFDLSASEDESSDIYLPPCKHLIHHTRESDRPVTRPRPKRELKYRDERDKKTLPTRTPTSVSCKNQELSGCSLKDVTNILLSPVVKIRKLSLSLKRHEDSPAVPLPKRRCTTITSYKEPTLASKLRRGDPFTDLCFLDSPIFKQKKDMRRSKRSTKHTQ